MKIRNNDDTIMYDSRVHPYDRYSHVTIKPHHHRWLIDRRAYGAQYPGATKSASWFERVLTISFSSRRVRMRR